MTVYDIHEKKNCTCGQEAINNIGRPREPTQPDPFIAFFRSISNSTNCMLHFPFWLQIAFLCWSSLWFDPIFLCFSFSCVIRRLHSIEDHKQVIQFYTSHSFHIERVSVLAIWLFVYEKFTRRRGGRLLWPTSEPRLDFFTFFHSCETSTFFLDTPSQLQRFSLARRQSHWSTNLLAVLHSLLRPRR